MQDPPIICEEKPDDGPTIVDQAAEENVDKTGGGKTPETATGIHSSTLEPNPKIGTTQPMAESFTNPEPQKQAGFQQSSEWVIPPKRGERKVSGGYHPPFPLAIKLADGKFRITEPVSGRYRDQTDSGNALVLGSQEELTQYNTAAKRYLALRVQKFPDRTQIAVLDTKLWIFVDGLVWDAHPK